MTSEDVWLKKSCPAGGAGVGNGGSGTKVGGVMDIIENLGQDSG